MSVKSDRVLQEIGKNWPYLVIILVPIVFCPVAIVINNAIGYTAYSILIMASYWMTECIPLAATSLLPIFLFPVFGVMQSKDVCSKYLTETNAVLIGGLMVAAAVEHWNLHKRMALRVLMLVGAKPRWLMFGFMITTAFLSMWISNTATTAMMIPIAQAVLDELQDAPDVTSDHKDDDAKRDGVEPRKTEYSEIQLMDICTSDVDDSSHESGVVDDDFSMVIAPPRPDPEADDQADWSKSISSRESDVVDDDLSMVIAPPRPDHEADEADRSKSKNEYRLLCKAITLCIPYAATIGGTATLTGTGPNLVISTQVHTLYGPEAGLNFGTWMMYAFPGMVVCLLLCWIWLQIMYLDCCCLQRTSKNIGNAQEERAKAVIRKSYAELGPMSLAEWAILFHFVVLVLLWLTRDPKFVSGWSVAFEDGYVTDATSVMFVSLLLFMFSSRLPYFCSRQGRNDPSVKPSRITPILTWPVVHEKMAWNVVLLLGGGAAMAEACKVSGLSAWLGSQLTVFGGLPPAAMALVISTIVAIFTEITSNTTTATIFIPIFAELSTSLGRNPLYMMLPAGIACSFAFMLPVATPPNSIAFAHGQLSVMDMAKAGLMMNIVCVLVSNLSLNTLGVWVFDVNTFPDWANGTTLQA
ncbi:Na(+)/citrate cotransporter-like [Diadema antillarum]|uniref:Na(+)/citrate cotransporter-like n=1 Tax=Diadema antillarum TaxID=105358 RepID=UPI003A85D281